MFREHGGHRSMNEKAVTQVGIGQSNHMKIGTTARRCRSPLKQPSDCSGGRNNDSSWLSWLDCLQAAWRDTI